MRSTIFQIWAASCGRYTFAVCTRCIYHINFIPTPKWSSSVRTRAKWTANGKQNELRYYIVLYTTWTGTRTSCRNFFSLSSLRFTSEDEWVRITACLYDSLNDNERPLCSFKIFDFGKLFGVQKVGAGRSSGDGSIYSFDVISGIIITVKNFTIQILVYVLRDAGHISGHLRIHFMITDGNEWLPTDRRIGIMLNWQQPKVCVCVDCEINATLKTCDIYLSNCRWESGKSSSRNKCCEKSFTFCTLITTRWLIVRTLVVLWDRCQ